MKQQKIWIHQWKRNEKGMQNCVCWYVWISLTNNKYFPHLTLGTANYAAKVLWLRKNLGETRGDGRTGFSFFFLNLYRISALLKSNNLTCRYQKWRHFWRVPLPAFQGPSFWVSMLVFGGGSMKPRNYPTYKDGMDVRNFCLTKMMDWIIKSSIFEWGVNISSTSIMGVNIASTSIMGVKIASTSIIRCTT